MRSDRFIGFLLTMLASCVIQLALVPRASGQDGVEVPVSLDLYYCSDIDQPAAEPGKWEPTARDFYFDLFLSQSNVGGDGSFLIYTTDESDPREVTYRIKLLNEGVVIGDMPLHPEEMEYVSIRLSQVMATPLHIGRRTCRVRLIFMSESEPRTVWSSQILMESALPYRGKSAVYRMTAILYC